ncbi:axin-1 isoform X3 [Dermacentor andersoni]|uniref:axin-1 isoform X3 n=1 Tax=Dermacentor andersoni TaxID=34620 RepID=UPI002417127C|nr:axin-2-like isoform X3 [Dermacentor andersoni]
MEDGDPGGRHPAEGADSRHHRECSPRPPWDPGKQGFPGEMGCSSVTHGSSCGSLSTLSENSSSQAASGSTPVTVSEGPLRWASDLRSLLVDLEGLRLFEQFLEQEGAHRLGLYFWFACNGLRSCPEPSVQLQYMKSIYRHYIRNSMVEVSPPLRAKITEHVKEGIVDVSLFDQAQREFEQFLQRSAYPKFLQSDLYVERVEKCHALATATAEAAATPSEGTASRGDDGQHCGGSSEEPSTAAANASGAAAAAVAAAESGPPSGEEDGSLPPVMPPMGLEILPTVKEDEELAMEASPAPLTRRNVWKLYRYGEQIPRMVARMASDATSAVPKASGGGSSSLGVPHPYHVNNSSFVPPSAQDSELHSLSSGAYTDDAATEVDSVPPAAPCSASAAKESLFQRATHRMSVRKNANVNRDSLGEHVIIPRTQMEHPYSLAEKNPEKFATSIIEKLHVVKKQLDCGERLERFHRAQAEDFPSAPPRGPPMVGAGVASASSGGGAPVPGSGATSGPGAGNNPGFCERLLGIPPEEVSSQSILDEHVSRVFDSPLSHTPPRAPSPRHRFGPAMASPYAVLGHQHWHKKERDACSSDSGAVRDYSPDDDAVHGSRRRAQGGCATSGGNAASRRTFRSGPQPSDSGVDSGASAVCEQPPVNQGATERVNNWILNHKVPGYPLGPPDPEKDSSRSHKKSTTSGTSSRSKQNSVNTSRSRSCGVAPGCGSLPGSGWGSQESGLPPTQQPPDTMTQLVEARRRLEVNYSGSQLAAKAKKWPKTMARGPPPGGQQGLVAGAGPQAAPGGGLCPAPVQVQAPSSPSTEMTVIGYCYSGETVPYRTKLAGRDITLRQFKSLISKKGNYRYFFRRSCQEFGTDVVSEEISDDNEVLPLWEGKIFAMVEPID